MWEEETRNTESSLRQQSMFDDCAKENMPPVRGANCSLPLIQVKLASYHVHNHVYLCMEEKVTKSFLNHRIQIQKKRGIPQNMLSHAIIENGTSESFCLNICLLYSEERTLCFSSWRHCI